MSWDDLDETHYDWPTVAELRDYRGRVRALVCDFIERMPIELPIHWQSPAWVILMGIEHERIHLETSSVLIRQLPLAWCAASPSGRSAPRRATISPPSPSTPCCRWPAARCASANRTPPRLGQRIRRAPHQAGPFQASRMLVSNAEYLAFVQAGGYETRDWWDDEGQGLAPVCQSPHAHLLGRRPLEPGTIASAADDRGRSPCPGTGRWR